MRTEHRDVNDRPDRQREQEMKPGLGSIHVSRELWQEKSSVDHAAVRTDALARARSQGSMTSRSCVRRRTAASADVARGALRLLLSARSSSAGRAMPDGRIPRPGGWNRIELVVDDLAKEVERLRAGGAHFRNDIVRGPGGAQILLVDPSGNLVELFEPGH